MMLPYLVPCDISFNTTLLSSNISDGNGHQLKSSIHSNIPGKPLLFLIHFYLPNGGIYEHSNICVFICEPGGHVTFIV